MESTGKRQKRLKLNKDFVPIPSDESDVNDEDMIPFNFQRIKIKLVKAPIAVEMETNCDSSSVSNLNNFNELIAAQIEKLNNVDQDEYLYRKNATKIINIFRKRSNCTMCHIHIGYEYGQKFDHLQHPLLKVLACTECINDYNKVDFKLSPDGQDQFCRWCGNTPMEKVPLRHCSACPFAFCETCVYHNLSKRENKRKNNWLCAVCNMKELWPLRNIFGSLVDFSTNLSRLEMFEEEKRHKLCDNNSKDIDDEEKTNGNPLTGLKETQTEEFYRLKYKIKPCSVKLIRTMFTKQ